MTTDKSELRRAMRARRFACDPALGIRMAGHVLAAGTVPAGTIVAGFWPLPGEIDTRPLLLALAGRGHSVALPVTPAPGQALSFRRWRPGAALKPGRFGTFEPTGEGAVPTVLLVPLLAFDRRGGRLGYGGGYYDRTLEALGANVMTIGCGFAAQEVDMVPTDTHDRFMNAVATEAGMLLVE